MLRIVRTFVLVLLAAVSVLPAAEEIDRDAIYRIKQEVFNHTEVMDHLFHLVEVYGPRITGSPGFEGAGKWASSRLEDWGAKNVKLERWGPFGQGWSRTYFSAHLIEPQYEMLIGVPLGWTPSTDGVVSGTPIITPFEPGTTPKKFNQAIDEFVAKYKSKLRGEMILITDLKDVGVQSDPAMHRLSEDDLEKRAEAPTPQVPIDFTDPNLEIPENDSKRARLFAQAPRWFQLLWRERMRKVQGRFNKFLTDEGVRLVIYPAAHGDGGTVFPPRSGDRRLDHPVPPPSIALTPEHYNRVYRLVDKKIPMKIEVEVKTAFHRDNLDSFNVVGELPGGSKKDEIVMIGAHLDSTAAALGATDNGAGCAVMLEVMRVLAKLDLKLDRTVRIALWGGEEEGLLGSKAYVKQHFADPKTMVVTAEHEKLDAYFNVDNGTGKIRGVHLQGNDMVRPIFKAWLEPFNDMGADTLTIRDTGGTDHLSFDAVGLPGFQFIQDPVEYETRTHHSNMDAYDHAQPGDLMQAVAIVASFVYHTANREEKLPRKPLPDPLPAIAQ